MNFNTDILTQFDKKWALLTAGKEGDFNAMTISWGGMGTIWNKPTVTVYVRPSRHTYGYINNNDYFTVSFYPEECKKDLGVMGSKSGRDCDKVALTSLTPKIATHGTMTFEQAEVTLVCKKLYRQAMDVNAMPEDMQKAFFANGDVHDMYIGEIVDIL